MRDLLRCCYDLERCLQRLTLGRGGPRDLLSIAITDEYVKKIADLIRRYESGYKFKIPSVLEELLVFVESIDNTEMALVTEIKSAIKEEPPLTDTDGEFIADG